MKAWGSNLLIGLIGITLVLFGFTPRAFSAVDGFNLTQLSGLNVKIGITSTSSYVGFGPSESGVSYVLGVSSNKLVMPLYGNILLQPELLLVNKSVWYFDYEAKTAEQKEVSATYLEVPLLSKVNMNISDVKFSFYVGPYLGLKITDSIDGSLKNSIEFQSYVLGMTAGESVTMKNISLEVRYDEELSHSIEGKSNSELDGAEAKFHTWMFIVGYHF